MEEGSESSKISKLRACDKENIMHSSLLQYYQNVMENTMQSSIKIERATKFLLLPEISNLVGDQTKAMFLMSKGLSHDEVSEAFKQYYRNQKETFNLNTPQVALNRVNQTEYNSPNTVQKMHPNPSQSGISLFLNLCQRVMVLAGISTAFYYLYQKWRSDKSKESKTKKEHRRIEEELNQIKSELQKITAELKLQQLTGKTNANLAAEINSLKAILVSRQHFEELQNKKISIPSWQLDMANASGIKDKNTTNNTAVNGQLSECTSLPDNASQVESEVLLDSVKTELDNTNTSTNDNQNTNQSNKECGEKIVLSIANGDIVSDFANKTKKSNSKSKSSKSKVNENGKNILKQNGTVKVNSE